MTLQPYNPSTLSAVDGEAVNHHGLTIDDYRRFRDALPDWRYRLIAMVLFNTGCRIGEVLALEGRHCRLAGPDYVLMIRRSKQRKQDSDYEAIYLNPGLGVQLADYIKGNQTRPADKVFTIGVRQIERVFKAAGLIALGHPVNPHLLRHLYVTMLVDGGVPVAGAAKLVGHSSTRTTEKWYYDLTSDKRRQIGERIQP